MTLHGARKRATFILRSSDATHVPPTEHALRQRIPEMIQSPDPGSQRDMGLIAGDTLTGVESPPPCPRLRRAHRAGVVALSLLAAVHPDDATSAPVRAPATQAHSALVLRCGKPTDRRVALTFDDGPNRKHTRQVLGILRKHNARATFFVLGESAKHNPDLIKQIAAEGHLVASHSWDHPKRIGLEEWRAQIQRTRDAILKAGVTPSPYLRPPHGIINKAVKQACAEQGLTIVLYTLLSSDWTLPGKDQLVRQVVGKLAPGGIVVLHDGGGDRRETVEALPEIIRGLRAKGLQLARLDELLGADPKVEECARR